MHGWGERSSQAAEKETRRLAHELVKLRMAGKVDALLKLFVEDVELRYNSCKLGVFPARHWRGHDALRETIRRTDIDFEPLDAEVWDVLVEGDRTAVLWTSNWRHRGTGRYYTMDMAHFLRWRNGRVAEMDEFLDYHAGSPTAGFFCGNFDDMLNPPEPGLSRDEMARRVTALGSFSREGPDAELFRRYCAPHVACEFVGDRSAIFYAGRHHGIGALVNIIRGINVEFQQVGGATPEVIVDGGKVATRRVVEWRHRGTGRRGIVELADFVRFESGLIVELIEFRDSVALLQMQD